MEIKTIDKMCIKAKTKVIRRGIIWQNALKCMDKISVSYEKILRYSKKLE